jgi:hypothetical protein
MTATPDYFVVAQDRADPQPATAAADRGRMRSSCRQATRMIAATPAGFVSLCRRCGGRHPARMRLNACEYRWSRFAISFRLVWVNRHSSPESRFQGVMRVLF